MTGLTLEPLLPAPVFAAVSTCALALLVWYAARRPGEIARGYWSASISLMGIGLALVLAMMLNPSRARGLPGPPGKPLLTLLVDDSASMCTPDAPGGTSRFDAAAKTAQAISEKLGGKFDLRIRRFDEIATSTDPSALTGAAADGRSTDLARAIETSLEADRPQGHAVVLLSDGIHNATPGVDSVLDSARLARALAAPIYTRSFGGAVDRLDIALELKSPQDLALVGQEVPLTVRVKSTGIAGAKTSVVLLRGGREVARRSVEISPVAPTDLFFLVSQDQVGLYDYEVRAEPLPGEATTANNSAVYVLRVVDEPIRVLLLEGKPYWDSKFLVRTLSSDPAVALDSVVQLRDTRWLRRTLGGKSAATQATAFVSSTMPRVETWNVVENAADVLGNADTLRGYQVIVLGRDVSPFLTDAAIANLQNWISQDGGSLVCYRGAPTADMPPALARLLPVSWSQGAETRFRMKLTDQGRELNWWPAQQQPPASNQPVAQPIAGMPALVTIAQPTKSKPLATILATATSTDKTGAATPVVVYQPYGTGRVVVIEGAGMWRWAFLPIEYQQEQAVYAGLWQSLLRWLTSGAAAAGAKGMLALRSDKVLFDSREDATATLLVKGKFDTPQPPRIELSASTAGGSLKTFAPAAMPDEPGAYRVNFGRLADGRYQAKVSGAAADDPAAIALFDVKSFGIEQLDLRARPDLMARIAADSGGAVLGDDPAGEVLAKFQQHQAENRPTRIEREPAWDRWWVMTAILAVWTAGWAVRRLGGLV